jgi:SAM-dependent methyltransferase
MNTPGEKEYKELTIYFMKIFKTIKNLILSSYSLYQKIKKEINILVYKKNGYKPWSRGYHEYKWKKIKSYINNNALLTNFKENSPLPLNYGFGVDERIVEYPWLISNINEDPQNLLDAGSALNFEKIISHKQFIKKKITITNLNPEHNCFWKKRVSYCFYDLRNLPFKEDSFDIITCLSTLEHVGMDNEKIYKNNEYKENKKEDYLKAVIELKRILKPDGKLLITLPYGQYQNLEFFQQFENKMIQKILNEFPNQQHKLTYYKYSQEGWNLSTEKECSNEKYFDIHTDKKIDSNNTAAARAVVCIKLIKE